MIVRFRDDAFEYRIQCPAQCELQLEDGTDYLIVPDQSDPGCPFRLCAGTLLEAAHRGDFGLQLLSRLPFN